MIENKKEFKKIEEFKVIEKKTPVSLLPNALTILGVCLGLSSIKFAIDLNYSLAVIAIGFAAILDTLDGRVARLIKKTSKEEQISTFDYLKESHLIHYLIYLGIIATLAATILCSIYITLIYHIIA